MIYDLGCLDQPDFLQKTFAALPGAFAAFAVMGGLALIGSFLNRSSRFRSYDIFSGWGFVAAFMTLSAVLFEKALPFSTFILFGFIALTVIPAVRQRYFSSPFWLLAFFPGLFIITIINSAGIAKWDDFSQWVPNALYLFQNDGAPGHGLPVPRSVWPGYPYALPFLTYLASWLAGGFLVQGGAMINFLLLMVFGAMLTENNDSSEASSINLNSIGRMALAFVVVTIANPAFNASFTVTNQGDTGTMVVTGVLGLLFLRMSNCLREKSSTVALMLPVASIASALVLIKQSNLVLLMLLTMAFLIIAAKNRNLKTAIMFVLPVVLPALVMRQIWQYYVNSEMDGNGFELHPFALWRFDLLGPLLHAMLQEMLKKSGVTILMLGVMICGGINFFRPATPLRNFTSMAAIVCSGYLLFLVIIYIGATFTEGEIRRAASFYRYTTHTGLLCLSVLWMAAPDGWKYVKGKMTYPLLLPGRMAHILGVLALVTLLPAIILINASIIVPQPGPAICQIRSLGRKLAAKLPDHTHLAVLEPESDGLFTFILRFELDLQSTQSKKALDVTWHMNRSLDGFSSDKLGQYVQQIENEADITAIIVPQAENDPLKIKGYDNHKAALMLQRNGKNWIAINP